MRSILFIVLLTTMASLTGCSSVQSTEVEIVGYLDCVGFYSRYEKEELLELDNCGTVDKSGLIQVEPQVVKLMDFAGSKERWENKNNSKYKPFWPSHLQCPLIHTTDNKRGGFAYIHENGNGRFATSTDNVCWPFFDGSSYGYVAGKVTYFNADLEVLKRTDYPFAQGRVVCSEKPLVRYGPNKSHNTWIGGKCGKLSKAFELATPIKHPYEYFYPLPEWAKPYYMRDGSFNTKRGKREELIIILTEAFEKLPGLVWFELGPNIHNPELLHVTERWESRDAYKASLDWPQFQNALERGRRLIETTNFQKEYEYDPENGKY